VIWHLATMSVTEFDTGVVVLGRFTHRAYPDIAIESGGGSTPFGFRFTVLDGRTGHKVWSRVASQLIVLGRAGSRLVPAVELTTDGFPATSPTTISDELDYEAIGVANKVIYRRHLSVSVPNTGGGTESDVGTFAFGDVEPDGSADTSVNLTLTESSTSGDVTKALAGYIDGRSGAFRPVSFTVATDGSLRSGRGTDLVATDTTKNVVTLTARNGVSRKRYYQRNVAGLHGAFQHLFVHGLRVSGHNCSDLSLTTVLGTDGVAGVLSARGAWLWSVRFPAAQMTGGTLRHYKNPKAYCV
jgi:hypothetical protein